MRGRQKPADLLLSACYLSLLLVIPAALAGCGARSTNVPVSGQVVVEQGIPLDEGRLVLIPDPPGPQQKPSGATIGKDGNFVCYSYSGGAGIPPGRYKVVLSFTSGMGGPNPYIKAFEEYTKVDTTPLVIDVPPAGVKDLVLTLKEPQ